TTGTGLVPGRSIGTNCDVAQYGGRTWGLCWPVIAPDETKLLLSKLDRIAELLRSPNDPRQMREAKAAAVSISQTAPTGAFAGLALQLVAALGAVDQFPQVP